MPNLLEDDERRQALFARLEKHLDETTPGWHLRIVQRSNEVRARMIDRSDPLAVQLIAVEVLRAEVHRRLISTPLFDDLDSDDTEALLEGFGQAFAYLNMKLREDGKL